MPDHNIYFGKKHGVPSGSFFTQIVDSIVNAIIAGTISAHFNLNLKPYDTFILGDDLLIYVNRDLSLATIASFASNAFGVTFNPSKSEKFKGGDKVRYLGRT